VSDTPYGGEPTDDGHWQELHAPVTHPSRLSRFNVWHDTRPRHLPTPADMMVLLHGILHVRGYVLACDADDREDGVTFGPLWWAIPADEWHERYAIVEEEP
jgi:hypothetical protein